MLPIQTIARIETLNALLDYHRQYNNDETQINLIRDELRQLLETLKAPPR
jgi:hypothetical protein